MCCSFYTVSHIFVDIRLPKYENTGAGVAVPGVQATTRFRINPTTTECEEFSYLGSGLNFNNFKTIEECESHCKYQYNRTQLIDCSGYNSSRNARSMQTSLGNPPR